MPIPYIPKQSGTALPYTPGQTPAMSRAVPKQDLETTLKAGNYGSQVGAEQVAGVKKIKESITGGLKNINTGKENPNVIEGAGQMIKGAGQQAFGTISGAAQTLFAPATPAISKLTEAITPFLRKQNPQLAKAYDNLIPVIQKISEKHPESATLVSDIINTLTLGIGGAATKKAIEKPIKEALTKDAFGAATKEIKNKTMSAVTQKSGDTVKITGKIIQGDTSDIANAKKILTSIDTKGIKTSKDLSDALQKNITKAKETLDKKLAESPIVNKPLLIKDFEKATKIGDKTVRHNYLDDMLKQLNDFYTSTNDIVALEKIKQLEAKGNSTGLTLQEANDLAREHGTNLNAFNANGQLSSGLSKQAAENTRIGVKETVRDAYGNRETAALDEQMSDAIAVKDLIDKRVEAVNKAQQKIVERGWGAKTGALVAKVLDTISGGMIKGATKELIGLKGDTTLNILDLEKSLKSDLAKLQKASKAETEAEMINVLNTILK